jgi:hypothetical protein
MSRDVRAPSCRWHRRGWRGVSPSGFLCTTTAGRERSVRCSAEAAPPCEHRRRPLASSSSGMVPRRWTSTAVWRVSPSFCKRIPKFVRRVDEVGSFLLPCLRSTSANARPSFHRARSAAIREARLSDTFVLARAGPGSPVRNEVDVLELLGDDPPASRRAVAGHAIEVHEAA